MNYVERIDFEGIKAAALCSARSLLQELIPNGRFEGREYVALNPSRADKSLGSFKINCHTGEWSEFATGAKGSDIIGWYAHAYGLNQGEAARHIAERLGLSAYKSNGSNGHTTEPPPEILSWGEEGPPTQYKELRRHSYPKTGAPKVKVKIKKRDVPKNKQWTNCYRVFRDKVPVGWQWKKPANYRTALRRTGGQYTDNLLARRRERHRYTQQARLFCLHFWRRRWSAGRHRRIPQTYTQERAQADHPHRQ